MCGCSLVGKGLGLGEGRAPPTLRAEAEADREIDCPADYGLLHWRVRLSQQAPPASLAPTKVVRIPMSEVDLADETFLFRAALRVGPLVQSIAAQGQQIPIVLRRAPQQGGPRYQIVSGFRRATAMRELGAPSIAAIVREDLADDELAFRASILENSQRRTYSDIDRALVIKRYEDRGYTSVNVAALMGLSKRQKNNIRSLLELPRTVREAIDDPDHPFTATHGLVLRQLRAKYSSLHYGTWIKAVRDGGGGRGLSVSTLKRLVHARYRDESTTRASIFRASDTRAGDGVFRLQPVKIDVAALSDEARESLREELQGLLDALGEGAQ